MNHKMDFVRQSYSDIAQGKQDTILSSSPDQQALNVSVGYSEEEISLVPPAANMGLGCGNPFRIVEVKEGDTLIDLGSGAGFDCFLASHKVGRKGRVIGVDMTPEMLSLARRTAKENRYRNVEFRLGEIENLPAADNLADVVISNCVINLSQNKPRVYREILRVLKPGGAIGISDIVIMKELPKEINRTTRCTPAECRALLRSKNWKKSSAWPASATSPSAPSLCPGPTRKSGAGS